MNCNVINHRPISNSHLVDEELLPSAASLVRFFTNLLDFNFSSQSGFSLDNVGLNLLDKKRALLLYMKEYDSDQSRMLVADLS